MSLRIAYVINSVEGGGAALPVPAVARALRDAGAEIAVFALTRRDGRAIAPMEASGLDVRVRDGGEGDHLAALRWLDREIARWRPTHLWTSLTRATLLGQVIGQWRRLPVVSWQHAAFLKPWNARLLGWRRNASMVWIVDSEAVRRHTIARLGITPDRLMVWPIFRADPDAPQAAAWRAGETVRIGTLGRLHPVKGYKMLIEAVAHLGGGGFELVIGGEGSERAALEARARDVPAVRLAGYVEDPRAFLAGLHLYVQSSRSEGLCVAAHEAMQAGLPVVATAVGELPYSVVPGETGWLVAPGDVEAMAGALREALGRPDRLKEMGAVGRSRLLERFGPERFEAAGRAIVARLRVGA